MADIHVSQESIQNMLRKLKIFAEDSATLLMTSKELWLKQRLVVGKTNHFLGLKMSLKI